MFGCPTKRLIDWLIDWLLDWLIDWLIESFLLGQVSSDGAYQSQSQEVFIDKNNFPADSQPRPEQEHRSPSDKPDTRKSPPTGGATSNKDPKTPPKPFSPPSGSVRTMATATPSRGDSSKSASAPDRKGDPRWGTDALGRPESIGHAEKGGIFEDRVHSGHGSLEGADLSSQHDAEVRRAPSITKVIDKAKEKILHHEKKH